MDKIIGDYCREPGVRSLQRYINRITEKLALKIVQKEKEIIVDENNVEDYIGHPLFPSQRIYKQTPKVIMSLS